MPKTKRRKTIENVFFAQDKAAATNYTERVNAYEGFTFYKVNKLHLAKRQHSHIHGWKTWTDS